MRVLLIIVIIVYINASPLNNDASLMARQKRGIVLKEALDDLDDDKDARQERAALGAPDNDASLMARQKRGPQGMVLWPSKSLHWALEDLNDDEDERQKRAALGAPDSDASLMERQKRGHPVAHRALEDRNDDEYARQERAPGYYYLSVDDLNDDDFE